MNFFDDYDTRFPDLIMDILEYFSISNGNFNNKTVLSFCTDKYLKPGSSNQEPLVQPEIIDRICTVLVNNNAMSSLKSGTSLGMKNTYACSLGYRGNWKRTNQIRNKYNSIVYGFDYVYRHYKDKVIPIVLKTKDDVSIGTCFKFNSGLVTAKHCLEKADQLSIKGYTPDQLNGKKIYTSLDDNVDIAYIEIGENSQNEVFSEPARIMQEVLTMGFPKIPQFNAFLNAEKAITSSIAEFTVKPSIGAVSSAEKNYLTNLTLILITAKIRGGNSGSPVINRNGSLIGIACQVPAFKGNYDDLGYGIVTPVEYLLEIINDPQKREEKTLSNFVDFIG